MEENSKETRPGSTPTRGWILLPPKEVRSLINWVVGVTLVLGLAAYLLTVGLRLVGNESNTTFGTVFTALVGANPLLAYTLWRLVHPNQAKKDTPEEDEENES